MLDVAVAAGLRAGAPDAPIPADPMLSRGPMLDVAAAAGLRAGAPDAPSPADPMLSRGPMLDVAVAAGLRAGAPDAPSLAGVAAATPAFVALAGWASGAALVR